MAIMIVTVPVPVSANLAVHVTRTPGAGVRSGIM